MACADEITWNMRQWAVAQASKGKKAWMRISTPIQRPIGIDQPRILELL